MANIVLVKVGGKKANVINAIGDYEMWFQRAAPQATLGVVDLRDEKPQWPQHFDAVIIMGSPHSVYEPLPWLPKALQCTKDLLQEDIPILGVCFGHQMICEARGGRVTRSSKGYEAGTVTIHATQEGLQDPLFGPVFQDGALLVNESHGDSVLEAPKDCVVLASNDHDPYQALRHSEKVWSVQFHPEIGLREAQTILADYRPSLEAQGHNVDALLQQAAPTPNAQSLIRRFIEQVRPNHG